MEIIRYILRDNEDNDLYAIIETRSDVNIKEIVSDIRNEWYEKEIDTSLIEYIKDELVNRKVNFTFIDIWKAENIYV